MAMTKSWIALLLCACAPQARRLVVPEGMRRAAAQPLPPPESKPTPATLQGALQPASATKARDGRYLLRLAEHNRVWELELPESSGGYEMRIPLDGPLDSPTAADAEILAAAQHDAAPNEPRKSYLGTLAKVREMYASRRYEMALVELVDLEAAHPKDGRLQAMKGSVYLKLGKTRLARESWQKALALDPEDPAVAESLRTLKEE
jgi:tetratricopeptide (TPR) repeat protein